MVLIVFLSLILLFLVFIAFFTYSDDSNKSESNLLSIKGMKLVEHHNASEEVAVCMQNVEDVLSEIEVKIDVESILKSNYETKI